MGTHAPSRLNAGFDLVDIRSTMASTRKSPLQATLKLPHRAPQARPERRSDAPPPAAAAGRSGAASDGLRELLEASLRPMVSTAFQGVDDETEARFFQLGELQVVISRPPVRDSAHRPGGDRRVTLEVWPAVGPRLLQVEWSGRRPYVIHRREGDWLPRLIRASRAFE